MTKSGWHKIQRLLIPLAHLYGLAIRLRLWLYHQQIFKTTSLPAPVISIGNITAGGTGKTPCTAFIANYLHSAGNNVAILSRGYKRASSGLVEVSDGTRILTSPDQSGDEPYLLAQKCFGARVVVHADRAHAGNWLAARSSVDVFLLDDGYQHIQLRRDLNILLMDATEPLSNYVLLPAGRLREPLTEMARADLVLITRADQVEDLNPLYQMISRNVRPQTPVFTTRHVLTSFVGVNTQQDAASLLERPFAAFAGIAKPENFWHSLQQKNIRLVYQKAFPDHHRFTVEEINAFVIEARANGAEGIVITEKDRANIPDDALKQCEMPILVAHLDFVCDQPEGFTRHLRATMTKARN